MLFFGGGGVYAYVYKFYIHIEIYTRMLGVLGRYTRIGYARKI